MSKGLFWGERNQLGSLLATACVPTDSRTSISYNPTKQQVLESECSGAVVTKVWVHIRRGLELLGRWDQLPTKLGASFVT